MIHNMLKNRLFTQFCCIARSITHTQTQIKHRQALSSTYPNSKDPKRVYQLMMMILWISPQAGHPI